MYAKCQTNRIDFVVLLFDFFRMWKTGFLILRRSHEQKKKKTGKNYIAGYRMPFIVPAFSSGVV